MCPRDRVSCDECGGQGHATKYHVTWERFSAKRRDKRQLNGKTSRVNKATFDEDEDGNYMSWSLTCTVCNIDDIETPIFIDETASAASDDDSISTIETESIDEEPVDNFEHSEWELVESNDNFEPTDDPTEPPTGKPTSPPTGTPTNAPTGLDCLPPGSLGSNVVASTFPGSGMEVDNLERLSESGYPDPTVQNSTSRQPGSPTVNNHQHPSSGAISVYEQYDHYMNEHANATMCSMSYDELQVDGAIDEVFQAARLHALTTCNRLAVDENLRAILHAHELSEFDAKRFRPLYPMDAEDEHDAPVFRPIMSQSILEDDTFDGLPDLVDSDSESEDGDSLPDLVQFPLLYIDDEPTLQQALLAADIPINLSDQRRGLKGGQKSSTNPDSSSTFDDTSTITDYNDDKDTSSGSQLCSMTVRQRVDSIANVFLTKQQRDPFSRTMAAGDTGAEDYVVIDRKLLYDVRQLDRPVNLIGVGGHRTKVTEVGNMHVLNNPLALLLESSDPNAVNLLSMGKVVDDGHYFHGDRTSLRVYREHDDALVLEGVRIPPGFWAFDISPSPVNYAAMPAQLETFRNLTREQINRAKGTRKLHVSLCHPNDEILGHMLDSHAIIGCPYTSADVRNAALCLGKCLACLKGKYREASTPTSMHPPAEKIGDNVHCDIIPFDCTTVGGYTYGLLMLDEKSNFPHIEGLVTKTSKRIVRAVEKAAKFYRRFGHTLRRITPDAEPNFISATLELGALAIGPHSGHTNSPRSEVSQS